MEIAYSDLIGSYLTHTPDVALVVCDELTSSLFRELNLLVPKGHRDNHITKKEQEDVILE